MNIRSLMMIIVVLTALLAITAVMPASAQSDRLEVTAAEDCTDGLTLTIEGEVGVDETLLVAWYFADESLGFSINQVALTDLTDTAHDIVIPHLPLPEGAESGYSVVLLTEETTDAIMALVMFSVLMEQPPDDTMIESTLEDLPVYNGTLSAEDCSIADMTPTLSNVEIDPEELQAAFMEFLEAFAGSLPESE